MNCIDLLEKQISNRPNSLAISSEISKNQLSYKELGDQSSSIASGLQNLGFEPKDLVLVFITPGIEFILTIFALFKVGAIVVLIDPGMGIKNFDKCVNNLKPKGLIGLPKAFFLKFFLKSFSSIKKSVIVSKITIPGFYNFKKLNDPNFHSNNRSMIAIGG